MKDSEAARPEQGAERPQAGPAALQQCRPRAKVTQAGGSPSVWRPPQPKDRPGGGRRSAEGRGPPASPQSSQRERVKGRAAAAAAAGGPRGRRAAGRSRARGERRAPAAAERSAWASSMASGAKLEKKGSDTCERECGRPDLCPGSRCRQPEARFLPRPFRLPPVGPPVRAARADTPARADALQALRDGKRAVVQLVVSK